MFGTHGAEAGAVLRVLAASGTVCLGWRWEHSLSERLIFNITTMLLFFLPFFFF